MIAGEATTLVTLQTTRPSQLTLCGQQIVHHRALYTLPPICVRPRDRISHDHSIKLMWPVP